jgi:hypothetical protein
MVVERATAVPGAAEASAQLSAHGTAEVRFLDAAGKPVGRRRRVKVEPAPVLEAPAAGGGITHVATEPLIAFMTRLPKGAVAFRLDEPGRDVITPGIVETASPRPKKPDSRRRFGAQDARFVLAIMAERFDREAAFHADCRQLLAAIEATAPFSEMPGRVAVEALFWKSDPGKGLFGPLQMGTGTDLIFGDRKLTAAFLEKSGVRSDLAIVLVNLAKRGGAGGTSKFPAWVTNQPSATDRWEDVAIHEIGHAFGLGDEYDSPNPQATSDIEPNIGETPDPARVPWAHLCNVAGPGPTAPFNGGATLPAGTIGTFEGARYQQHGRFRPQFACRMRTTRDPFCERCRELIRARIA